MGRVNQKRLVKKWTGIPVGTAVRVTMDDGTARNTKTRSAAQMLGDHTAVIWLDGITGCYALERVRVL